MAFIDNVRSKYCKKPKCQLALVKMLNELKKYKHNELHKALTDLHESHLKNLLSLESQDVIPVKLLESIEQHKPVTALLPDNSNVVTTLPETRKEGFLYHLKALFNDMQAGDKNTLRVYSDELKAPLSPEESTLLGKACKTCKGYCCTSDGADNAYQDYPSLELYLSTQSAGITGEELVENYRRYIPTKTYKNACVFQGDRGCTLPSNMRSFTCNNFLCSSLNTLRKNIAKSHSKLTYAAAIEDDKITRNYIFDKENFVLL
ncbi:hypothetical protein [uncultured Paraglaciecola sp.]|uniref:hypothetical protein n=1 Tax=uncultured Paraglaciecola sp. TaxID=1765024 RepID=UPI0030DD70CB|tara:strand:- start:438047 stop:438829 length:783 start_codon:yes stop_codon:yes gene_type:complete